MRDMSLDLLLIEEVQGARIDRELGHLVQPAVKGEQRGFVATRL